MKLTTDSVIIFVQDVEQLKFFYTDILAFSILEEQPAEWLLLNAGSCKIGLHKIGNEYLKNTTAFKFDNNTKIVFEVDENIETVREYLLSKNVAIKEIKAFDNYAFLTCDFEDPEGNVFQLKQPKKQ